MYTRAVGTRLTGQDKKKPVIRTAHHDSFGYAGCCDGCIGYRGGTGTLVAVTDVLVTGMDALRVHWL